MESTNFPTLRGPSAVYLAHYREWIKKQIKRIMAGGKLSGHSILLCWSLKIMEHLGFLREGTAYIRYLLKRRIDASTAGNRYIDLA